jgi:tRNA pseudouridine38-40 synthase
MQVVAFRANWPSGPPALTLAEGLGALLLRPAPKHFHPQWSARGKTYRYRLALRPGLDATWDVTSEARLLDRSIDFARLAELLDMARGARDFGAFHPNSSPRRKRVLTETRLQVLPNGSAEIVFQGDGFARHQVRYLVGSAVAVAAGVLSEEQWRDALERAEPLEGLRAPAHGLTLWEVHYPDALDPFTAEERSNSSGVPRGWPLSDDR